MVTYFYKNLPEVFVKTMKLSNNGVQVNEDGIVLSSEEYENYIYIK